MNLLGIVVIGRNEGERLRVCLQSVIPHGSPVIYVDSGSQDGSAALAKSLGVDVIEVDPAQGFSAARARNEGFNRITTLHPNLHYVQFVDGDCEIFPAWLPLGAGQFDQHAEAAVICGRVLERNPQASVYNRLCSLEWQKTPGEIPACGGIFMARVGPFRASGGFRPDVVAGEEEELCLRLRRDGGKILHVDTDMVLHDSAMLRLSQWWLRAQRAGHAYAQGAALHGSGKERHAVRDCRRIWFWGLLVPLLVLAPAWPTRGASLALLLIYPLQFLRISRNARKRGWSSGDARVYAAFSILAKFPALLGLLQYHFRRWRKKPLTIIEHKEPRTSG